MGKIPRIFRSHKTPAGWAYAAYARAKIARFGSLPADARPWLKVAGRLVIRLDAVQVERERLEAELSNGAGRRRRERLRVEVRRLDRRERGLRRDLLDAERRLEELATAGGSNRHGRSTASPAELVARAQAAIAAAGRDAGGGGSGAEDGDD